MSDGFGAVPAELDRHAGTLNGLADRAQQTGARMQAIRLDAGAYGYLCSFFPTTLLASRQENLEATGRDEVEALRGTAERLRRTAVAIDELDSESARAMVLGDLAGGPPP